MALSGLQYFWHYFMCIWLFISIQQINSNDGKSKACCDYTCQLHWHDIYIHSALVSKCFLWKRETSEYLQGNLLIEIWHFSRLLPPLIETNESVGCIFTNNVHEIMEQSEIYMIYGETNPYSSSFTGTKNWRVLGEIDNQYLWVYLTWLLDL